MEKDELRIFRELLQDIVFQLEKISKKIGETNNELKKGIIIKK